jgi:hypothetical protein
VQRDVCEIDLIPDEILRRKETVGQAWWRNVTSLIEMRVINTEDEPLWDRSICRQWIDSDYTVKSERVGIAVMLQAGIREDFLYGHKQSSITFSILFFSLSRRMRVQCLEIIQKCFL